MEYRHNKPVTKAARVTRRKQARAAQNRKEEANRQRARTGEPNELGITQGQNAEQGNTFDPAQAADIGRTSQP